MYSTFTYYTAHGGLLTEAEYNKYAEDAADIINYRTFGRAETAPEEMQDKIRRCECKLVDALSAFSNCPAGVSSESNDGYSVSYSTTAKADLDNNVLNICRRFLMMPENLMYTGVG